MMNVEEVIDMIETYYKKTVEKMIVLRGSIKRRERLLNRSECPLCNCKLPIKISQSEIDTLKAKLAEYEKIRSEERRVWEIEHEKKMIEDRRKRKEFITKYLDIIKKSIRKRPKRKPEDLILSDEEMELWNHEMEILIDPHESDDYGYEELFFDNRMNEIIK